MGGTKITIKGASEVMPIAPNRATATNSSDMKDSEYNENTP
jgi:hypothetical protein